MKDTHPYSFHELTPTKNITTVHSLSGTKSQSKLNDVSTPLKFRTSSYNKALDSIAILGNEYQEAMRAYEGTKEELQYWKQQSQYWQYECQKQGNSNGLINQFEEELRIANEKSKEREKYLISQIEEITNQKNQEDEKNKELKEQILKLKETSDIQIKNAKDKLMINDKLILTLQQFKKQCNLVHDEIDLGLAVALEPIAIKQRQISKPMILIKSESDKVKIDQNIPQQSIYRQQDSILSQEDQFGKNFGNQYANIHSEILKEYDIKSKNSLNHESVASSTSNNKNSMNNSSSNNNNRHNNNNNLNNQNKNNKDDNNNKNKSNLGILMQLRSCHSSCENSEDDGEEQKKNQQPTIQNSLKDPNIQAQRKTQSASPSQLQQLRQGVANLFYSSTQLPFLSASPDRNHLPNIGAQNLKVIVDGPTIVSVILNSEDGEQLASQRVNESMHKQKNSNDQDKLKQVKNQQLMKINEEDTCSINTPSSFVNNKKLNSNIDQILNDIALPKKNKEFCFDNLEVMNSQYNVPAQKGNKDTKSNNNLSFGNNNSDLKEEQPQQKPFWAIGMLTSSSDSMPLHPRQAVSHIISGWESHEITPPEVVDNNLIKKDYHQKGKNSEFLPLFVHKFVESEDGWEEDVKNIMGSSDQNSNDTFSIKELAQLLEISEKGIRTVAVGTNNMLQKVTALREQLSNKNSQIEKIEAQNIQLLNQTKNIEILNQAYQTKIDDLNIKHQELTKELQGEIDSLHIQLKEEKESNQILAKDNLNLHKAFTEIKEREKEYPKLREPDTKEFEKQQRIIFELETELDLVKKSQKGILLLQPTNASMDDEEQEIEIDILKKEIELWKIKHKGIKKELGKLKEAFETFRQYKNGEEGKNNNSEGEFLRIMAKLESKFKEETNSARDILIEIDGHEHLSQSLHS